tara:strand:+ start:500 stop:712 length:213 start_codon:yes stop_codon:yes gene_type:complete
MGPFSEKIQQRRADAIKHLLATNPQMDEYMKSVWESKLNGLAQNEDEYNKRVKQVYSLLKPQHKGWVTYE